MPAAKLGLFQIIIIIIIILIAAILFLIIIIIMVFLPQSSFLLLTYSLCLHSLRCHRLPTPSFLLPMSQSEHNCIVDLI